MSQGNPIALKKTLDSLSGVVDEIIFGDLLIFEKDRNLIQLYKREYNLKIVTLPFNYIFIHGFSDTLNKLAEESTNDMVIYLNCSEAIQSGKETILPTIKNNPDCNTFCFNHSTDPHHWYRIYNRKELKWSGVIHEQVCGDCKQYPEPIFTMQDFDKDTEDSFYSMVMNEVKELVYFNNYLKLVDQPHLIGFTNAGWVQFVKDGYHSFIERLHKKGNRYEAFITGNYEMFMNDIFTNEEFKEERFNSSLAIEFQGDKKYLL